MSCMFGGCKPSPEETLKLFAEQLLKITEDMINTGVNTGISAADFRACDFEMKWARQRFVLDYGAEKDRIMAETEFRGKSVKLQSLLVKLERYSETYEYVADMYAPSPSAEGEIASTLAKHKWRRLRIAQMEWLSVLQERVLLHAYIKGYYADSFKTRADTCNAIYDELYINERITSAKQRLEQAQQILVNNRAADQLFSTRVQTEQNDYYYAGQNAVYEQFTLDFVYRCRSCSTEVYDDCNERDIIYDAVTPGECSHEDNIAPNRYMKAYKKELEIAVRWAYSFTDFEKYLNEFKSATFRACVQVQTPGSTIRTLFEKPTAHAS